MIWRAEIGYQHGGDSWEEALDLPGVDRLDVAIEQVKATVQRFNETLKPGEPSRRFIRMLGGSEETSKEHAWRKQNLMTETDGRSLYDRVRCEACGVTGRRYGLSERVTLDPGFRRKGFQDCDTARQTLEKRRRQAEVKGLSRPADGDWAATQERWS